MTPEEMRIAIAEVFEFSKFEITPTGLFGWKQGFVKDGCYYNGTSTYAKVPDYLNDLNAMHEAEKILSSERGSCSVGNFNNQICYYVHLLGLKYTSGNSVQNVFAEADQRAEAFLKTIGKWKD